MQKQKREQSRVQLRSTSSYDQWPAGCQYFRPGLDDVDEITSLLDQDTTYTSEISPWHLNCTTVTTDSVETRWIKQGGLTNGELARLTSKDIKFALFHVRFHRAYKPTHSVCHISLDKESWRKMLHSLDIMPLFIKLLHNNNGGSFAHTSYDMDAVADTDDVSSTHPLPTRPTPSSDTKGDVGDDVDDGQTASALHIAYKLGTSADQEIAIYSRADFKQEQVVILVVGHESAVQMHRVRSLFQNNKDASWLSVITMLFSRRYDNIERVRWNVDFRTQQHEALTGFAAFGDASSVTDVEKLDFNRDLYVTSDICRDVTYGANRLLLNCQAFLTHLTQYQDIIRGTKRVVQSTAEQLQSIREDCALTIEQVKHQLDQNSDLSRRLLTQADVKKTLINQRDMQLTLEISQATKRDSELMRGIAAVTMIFLPATFVATFFSMVFFHVDDGNHAQLLVNSSLWLYPVVTVPLTLVITSWYLAWSFGWFRSLLTGADKRTANHV